MEDRIAFQTDKVELTVTLLLRGECNADKLQI